MVDFHIATLCVVTIKSGLEDYDSAAPRSPKSVPVSPLRSLRFIPSPIMSIPPPPPSPRSESVVWQRQRMSRGMRRRCDASAKLSSQHRLNPPSPLHLERFLTPSAIRSAAIGSRSAITVNSFIAIERREMRRIEEEEEKRRVRRE